MTMPPNALTREQVEFHVCEIKDGNILAIKDHADVLALNDAALRHALAQQVQEIERLRTGQGISSAEMDLSKQLATLQATLAGREQAIDALRAECRRIECINAQQAQRIQELEEQRVRYGPICVICGKDKPCMTEAEANQQGGSIPCTFDPAPKELWQRYKQQAREIERLRERVRVLDLTQCTSPWDDSPPCRGIQRELDKLAAMTAERDEAIVKYTAQANRAEHAQNVAVNRLEICRTELTASQARVRELEGVIAKTREDF